MSKIRKRVKGYIDTDVYIEAKKRIHHIFATFDKIVVMFSGGKDSLVVVHLVKEVSEELGIDTVDIVFRDEELIPHCVIDFVESYYHKSWVNMKYFAVPLHSQKYVLGKTESYIQWDKSRSHIRNPPDFAITTPESDERVFTQDTMDGYTASNYSGKIAFLNGIRSSESLVRYRASVNKMNENYINATKSNLPHVKFCKPIFDWEENYVFKYFYEKKIDYCKVYDWQMWNGDQFRVATPVHQEGAKSFNKLKTLDPTLYSQIIDIFPEMIVQELYYKEYDRNSEKARYNTSLHTVLEWIKENITDPKQRHESYKMFKTIASLHKNEPHAYPVDHILNHFMTGGYKRMIMPNVSKK